MAMTIMKRSMSFLLALVMLFTMVPLDALAAEEETTEVVTEVGKVEELAETTPPDEEIQPQAETAGEVPVTRAQWLQLLVQTFDYSIDGEIVPDNYFPDLSAEAEYYNDVLIAVYYGLVDVLPNSNLRPDEAATREFAAYTLNACMGYLPEAEEYEFSEAASVTYSDDIQVAIERGWFALSGGAFLPEQPITLEEKNLMVADAESYIADIAIDGSHESAYTFKEGVIEITEEVTMDLDAQGLIITIPNLNYSLKEGDKIVVYQDGLAVPYQVVSTAVVGRGMQVRVSDLYFEDAIDTMDVQMAADTDPANFYAAEDTELIFIEESTGDEYTQQQVVDKMASGSKNIYIPKYSKSFEVASGITASLNVELKNAKLCYKVDIGITKAEASVWLDTDVDVSAKLSCSLADMIGEGFEVYIGGYDVPGVGGLAVYVKMDISGTITVVKKLHMKVGVKVGFNTLKWKATKSKIFKVTDKGSTMTAEISAKLCLEAKFGVYGKSLPLKGYLYGEAGFKASVKYTEYEEIIGTCTHFAAFLYAEYGVKIEWGLLGYKNTIDWNKEPINEDNSPVKISIHYEDGKQVSKCTRTDLEGTSSGTSSKITDSGYTTSPKSPYSGSGLPRGSSTGSSDSGEPIIIYEYTLDDADYATLTKYSGTASSLSVPSTIDGYPIVAIGSGAFEDCTGLTSVILPDSITQIGSGAFRNCSRLKRIELPAKLEFLDQEAFAHCTSLSYIKIPKTLTRAYAWNGRGIDGIFYGCTSLKTVTLEKGMTIVAPYLFCGAPAIETITIPDTVTEIGLYAFAHAGGLKDIVIPDSVVTIGDHAFLNCTALETVTFSRNLTALNTSAFEDCAVLKRVELPDSLKEIGNAAFKDCTNLAQVKLPSALEFIDEEAFVNCTSLTEITIPKTLTRAYAWNGRANDGIFYGCTALTNVTLEEGMTIVAPYLFCGAPAIKTITIPDTVTEIGLYAFAHAGGLENIVIPDSVVTIDSYAFLDCTGLKTVTLSQNLTTLNTSAFEDCTVLPKVELPDSLKEIQNAVFKGCTNLAQVKLPSALEFLNEEAFVNCTSLTEITIPKTLTRAYAWNGRANDGIFYGCTALTNVTLEEGMTIVAPYLFCGAPAIETITIPNTVTEIGSYAFAHTRGLKNLEIPDSVVTINSYAFLDSTALETVRLPQRLNSLGIHAFENCSALQQITVSEGITTIGDNTFAGCIAMTSAVLPDSVTRIGEKAFNGCTALAQVTFSANLKTIAEYAFQNSGLTSLELPESLERIERNAFANNDCLTEAVISRGVTYLGTYCFSDCDVLARVVIPNSVTKLETYCFDSCDLLTDVTLGLGLTEIPSYAFSNCPELDEIVIPYFVTKINSNAFKSSAKLAKVVTHEKLTSIDSTAFSYPTVTKFYGTPDSYTQTWCESNGYTFNENTVAATKVTVRDSALSIPKGQSKVLDFTIEPGDFGDTISFRSSNTGVVTVDENGKLTAVAPGTATIRINVGSVSASCKVTVTQAVTKITLDKKTLALDVPETYQLTATITPADASNKVLTWTSSNEAAATVDQNGLVTAVGNGTAVITATATDGTGISASCTVTVIDPDNIPVASIALDKTSLELEALEIWQLTATVSPGNAANKQLRWTSSDENVATVDENGKVTALAKGTATITAAATDESGVTASCSVTVTNTAHVVTDPDQLESPHNYPLNCTDFWLYTAPGARALSVTFDQRTYVEDEFDFLFVYDGENNLIGQYTGGQLAGVTLEIPGDTVKIQLQSDDVGTDWGFKATVEVMEHQPGSPVVENRVEATCETDGHYDNVVYCTVCGEELSRETVTIPATGHSYESVVTAPTCTEQGYTTHTCTACGHSYVDSYVDAHGHHYEDGFCVDCGEPEPVETPVKIASGWSGTTQWTLMSDGTLTVYGTGNMKNYGYNGGQPWLNKGVDVTSVVIEEGVTAIGTGAFRNLTTLESVTLPEKGLTKIGEAAFYGCTSLKEIEIPETIYTVWLYTFKNCTALEKVKFPKSLIKVDQGAFENCTSLPYIYFPTNVEIIGSWSFKGCTGLIEADMTWTDATKIREGAFKNCSALTTIRLPVNIQTLGDSCFYGIGATSFTVPETVTSIEAWCFARAYSLTKITFKGNAPTIGQGAFNKITLTAYYPRNNTTWTSAVKQNYGGTVTWKAN